MKLTRKTTKKGEVTVTLDGKTLDHVLSRELTGTICEGSGIFMEHNVARFRFGNREKLIKLGHLQYSDPLKEIARVLKTRIETVRAWVNGFKDTIEEVEFEPAGFVPGFVGEVKTTTG